jgi:hypothetical protein
MSRTKKTPVSKNERVINQKATRIVDFLAKALTDEAEELRLYSEGLQRKILEEVERRRSGV